MDRLLELEYVVQEISNIEPEILEENVHWKETADVVIAKLRQAHLQLSQKYQSTNYLTLNNSLLTPPHSAHSAGSTSSIHSDSSSLYADNSYSMASQAFDRQIYSRCVQIAESAQQNGPIEMPLISLAHHSYMAMVDDAENADDALKFTMWWIQFLESVEPGRTMGEKSELFEYRLIALERLYQVEEGQQLSTAIKILKLLVRSYKLILVSYRPFHPNPLRRLEQLATWVDELKHNCKENSEFNEASTLLEEGLRASEVDKKKYENERSMKKFRSLSYGHDYALCYEIMKTLNCKPDDTKSSNENNNIHHEENLDIHYTDDKECLSPIYSSEENIIVRL